METVETGLHILIFIGAVAGWTALGLMAYESLFKRKG